jgi:hypothetical protein
VHPPGLTGPKGTCSGSQNPALTEDGSRIIYPDTAGTVHLLNRNLVQVESLATGSRRVEILDAEYGNFYASILEWHDRGDSLLWREFVRDDPSISDSVWLVSPREVRLRGEGLELVCGAADESQKLPPCWHPMSVSGFPAAFEESRVSDVLPEWDPETGVLAYLDAPARFVLLNPVSGGRVSIDADATLSAYRP